MTLDLLATLPPDWRSAMSPYLDPATVAKLADFMEREYAEGDVFPPFEDLYAAFRLCP